VTVAGAFLVGVAAIAIPPSYTSTAAIIVDRPAPVRGAAAEEPDEAALDTHVAMLTSEAHARRVLDTLTRRADFKAELPPPARTAVDEFRNWLLARLQSAKSALYPSDRPEEIGPRAGTQGPTLAEFRRALKVNKERRSWIISVSYTDKSPEKTAIIANEVVQSHIQNLRERKRDETEHVLAWLDRQLAEVGAAWKQADTAVRQYRASHGASNPDMGDLTFAQMRRQLAIAQSDSARRQGILDRIRDLQRRGADEDSLAEVLGTPKLSDLHREDAALRQDVGAPAAPSDDPRPQLLSGRESPPQLRAQIAETIEGAIRRLENETQVARSRVQTIEKHLEALQSAAAANSKEKTELQALERRADSAAKRFDDLQRRQQDSAERRDFLEVDAHIVAPAWKAARPSSINPVLFIPPALIAFFLFGGVLAVTLERLDRSLHSERDVADTLGVPCIGLVPEITCAQSEFRFVSQNPSSTYGQAIGSTVVAALQLTSPPREPKVVLVTSSLPREGKTTLAISFGEYSARIGLRVLLVDLGLRDHAATEDGHRFDQADGLKLFDQPVAKAIRRIADLGIDYLSARDVGIDAVGFLASEKGRDVFRQLRNGYDCIIIDGPPVFASAEARMLASIADKVVVAVRWGKTRRDVAANAIQLLRHSSRFDCDALSSVYAVLTRVNLAMHARYRYGDTGEFLRIYSHYYAPPVSVRAHTASSSPPARSSSP
jgi:uncharacterized protein involved in exopolysaccharide biosynthesis/Mrp family chromosome partitioning ATPase